MGSGYHNWWPEHMRPGYRPLSKEELAEKEELEKQKHKPAEAPSPAAEAQKKSRKKAEQPSAPPEDLE